MNGSPPCLSFIQVVFGQLTIERELQQGLRLLHGGDQEVLIALTNEISRIPTLRETNHPKIEVPGYGQVKAT